MNNQQPSTFNMQPIPPGYKQTEVGVIPNDWEVSTFGDVFDVTAGGDVDPKRSKSYQDEIHCYPIYSNALTNYGLYGYCSYADHPAATITITARGMVGSANFRDHPYTAIGRVLVLQPKSEIAGRYFADVINSRVKFANESTGVPQLTAPQISTYRLPVPPLPEQRAIAGALSDVDALLGALDQLIAKKRDLKQAAMQQLLTGQTRLPGFHGEWAVKRLGELLDYEQPTKYLVKDSEYSDDNDVPVLTAGKTFILGYTNEKNGIYDDLPAIIFDDFTTAIKYVTFPFKAKSSAMKILKPRDKAINLRLIFEIMQSIEFKLGDHKRYWISEYQHLPIKFPDAKEQTAMAEVLTDMDAELAALEQRRAKTRALKQGMMQELLTGRIRLM
jgi:type I restriction enzyme S subunit